MSQLFRDILISWIVARAYFLQIVIEFETPKVWRAIKRPRICP
nr:MAG TPA: hypothetical protein [Caudoviricetes sp.]